ncbi:hypothetical protein BU24DRAFT_70525 [Aaosphaeria arxii CBS 175.79]|uniref:HPt domain-containing protein n=1 Tax=Aaosphaeria arxii CBS 175.79 TaxID=1450172 RepID=A0A6A5XAW5_9PLEO|nr:uncharacterized protein BU24DRAFT_70525 [Aaosphaeria arxii CBS 175.79]KAF2010102.1 hypothetical protein BU24DRAFT_70525 [Aaosphaeria arxii CBS 175.79]
MLLILYSYQLFLLPVVAGMQDMALWLTNEEKGKKITHALKGFTGGLGITPRELVSQSESLGPHKYSISTLLVQSACEEMGAMYSEFKFSGALLDFLKVSPNAPSGIKSGSQFTVTFGRESRA